MKKLFYLTLITLSFITLRAQTTFTASTLRGDTVKSMVMMKATDISATGIVASDTIRAQAAVVAEQNLQVNGNINTSGNISVNGNATFNGTLKSTTFGGIGSGLIYADSLGNLFKAIPGGGGGTGIATSFPCVASTIPWYEGGNSIGTTNGNNSIGTCNAYDFILKANNNQAIWVKPDGKIGFNTTNPNARFEITGSGSTDGIRYNSPTGGGSAFEISTTNLPAYSRFKTYGTGQTFIGQFITPGNDFDVTGSMLTIGQSNVNYKAFNIVNNSTPSSPIDLFSVSGSGQTLIGNPTINNIIAGSPVNPYMLEIAAINKSGIRLTSNSNNVAGNPSIRIGNTIDNKDQFLVFGDGHTYIGDDWTSTFITQGTYAGLYPKLVAQSTSPGGFFANDAAFSAIVKNQNINEGAGKKGYLATFESDNKRTRAIAVFCTDPSLPGVSSTNIFESFKVYADGRTYIGSQNVASRINTASLTVNGEIVCKALYVFKPVSWSDKVFKSNYKLQDLKEVEKYINKNNHLPGIKSEEEIMENGYDVNETDAMLLEKIENLYLYIIQQQKEIDELKSKIKSK